jgi:putative ABC transport system ATP-binding protein
MTLLEGRNLRKTYRLSRTNTLQALRGVHVAMEAGEMVAIMGPSGSGKTTLMHLLGLLHSPDAAGGPAPELRFDGADVTRLSDGARTRIRARAMGFVFQSFNLVPTLTAIENITLPMDIAGRKPDQQWLDTVITTVGLGDRLTHKPSQLSGGQQQRVACARALAGRPDIVFADEPTGNLDSVSGAEVLGFLQGSVREFGQTVVMVTHDPNAAGYADRVLFLADGRIVDEMLDPTSERVLDRIKSFDAHAAAHAAPVS